MRRVWRRARIPVAIVCAGLALAEIAAPAPAPVAAQTESGALLRPNDDVKALAAQGKPLFEDTCSSCHGPDARGIAGRGPNLRGVGEEAVDFYLRTNRMPLQDPEDQPERHPSSPFDTEQKREVAAFVASFGGPGIPNVDPASADIAEGQRLFTDSCAGCHQVVARGGNMPKARIPDLLSATPLDVAEAVDVGPYLMSNFRTLSDDQVSAIAKYVEYTKDPQDRGGWGLGHLGPIPEGMAAWLLGAFALVLTIRIIGERTPT